MKYYRIALFLFLLVFPLFHSNGQPRLTVIGGNRHDWGTLYQTEKTLTAKIGIKNTGNQNLVIRDVRPACGCTTAPIEKSNLAPGETTYLNVTLTVSPERFGKINKPIDIVSNSAQATTETISLVANIIKPLQPSSNFIAFPPMVVGKRVSASISLLNTTDKTIGITSIEPKAGILIRCKPRQKIKPHARITITAETTPEKSHIGYFHSQAVISTSHPAQSSIVVNIYGEVKASEMQAQKSSAVQ
jgi:hypothetical protein